MCYKTVSRRLSFVSKSSCREVCFCGSVCECVLCVYVYIYIPYPRRSTQIQSTAIYLRSQSQARERERASYRERERKRTSRQGTTHDARAHGTTIDNDTDDGQAFKWCRCVFRVVCVSCCVCLCVYQNQKCVSLARACGGPLRYRIALFVGGIAIKSLTRDTTDSSGAA